MNDEIKLADVDKSQLPADLKDLPEAEQKEAIEQKIANRKKLQSEMDALVKKRSDFITAEKAKRAQAGGKEDSFDMQVKSMIRAQGKSKGIDFKK